MQLKFFTIPINSAEDFEKEINAFMSTHKVVEIEKHLTQSAGQSYWCIYIGYIGKVKSIYNNATRPKIDYKKLLSEQEFIKFEQLRVVRKEISKEDAVSAFVVATDAEFIEIVKLPKLTFSTLKKVKGFGEKKAEKYGKNNWADNFLKRLNDSGLYRVK